MSTTKVTSISAGRRATGGPTTTAKPNRTVPPAQILRALSTPAPVLPNENAADYNAFRSATLDHFAPQDPQEIATVLDYIDLTWRLRRIVTLEAALFELEIDRFGADAQDFPLTASAVETLEYEDLLETLAIESALQSKAIVQLQRHEDQLSRRRAQLQPRLDQLLANHAAAPRADRPAPLDEAA